MDIKQLQNQPRVSTSAVPKSTGKAAEQTSSSTATAASDDSVVVSTQAQQLQDMQSRIASLPDMDMQKVADIKAAIAEGRYKVDPEKLANNIAQFEADMEELDQEG